MRSHRTIYSITNMADNTTHLLFVSNYSYNPHLTDYGKFYTNNPRLTDYHFFLDLEELCPINRNLRFSNPFVI